MAPLLIHYYGKMLQKIFLVACFLFYDSNIWLILKACNYLKLSTVYIAMPSMSEMLPAWMVLTYNGTLAACAKYACIRDGGFQLWCHSCLNNVQHCLCHLYTRMRHSKQTATFDISLVFSSQPKTTDMHVGHVWGVKGHKCSSDDEFPNGKHWSRWKRMGVRNNDLQN